MHFLFFLFSFFPPFSNRPQQEAPAAGGLHLTENSQSCHSEERSDVGISGKTLHRHSGLLKNQSSPKFQREGSCERKPSGFPFASNHPPQRQNCKIMIQKLILQFGKQLGEKAQRDFFDKLTQRNRSGLRVQKASQSSPPADGEKSEIIFSGGVYVGENTAQPASVRIARL